MLPVSAAGEIDTAEISRYELDMQKKRELIRVVEEEMLESRGRETELERELRILESDISALSKKIRSSTKKLRKLRRQENDLQDQIGLVENKVIIQKKKLARYIRLSYYLGEGDVVKRIFNLTERKRVERNLDILNYIKNKRIFEFEQYHATFNDLAENRARVIVVRQEIQEVLTDLGRKRKKLAHDASSRRKLLEKVRNKLTSQKYLVATNKREVKELAKLITKLKIAVGTMPIPNIADAGFGGLKKKLIQPVAGKKFTRVSGLKGVLFAADAGDEVRTVASGRVVFADWLRGYGLMSIIDHGDGYLSLYGRNQVLYRELGEWVRAGDVIALSGSTGAVRDSGLYFEIRKDGSPLDVAGWF